MGNSKPLQVGFATSSMLHISSLEYGRVKFQGFGLFFFPSLDEFCIYFKLIKDFCDNEVE